MKIVTELEFRKYKRDFMTWNWVCRLAEKERMQNIKYIDGEIVAWFRLETLIAMLDKWTTIVEEKKHRTSGAKIKVKAMIEELKNNSDEWPDLSIDARHKKLDEVVRMRKYRHEVHIQENVCEALFS